MKLNIWFFDDLTFYDPTQVLFRKLDFLKYHRRQIKFCETEKFLAN